MEAANVEIDEKTVARSITSETRVVLAFHVEGSGQIRFVRSSDLKDWKVTAEDAWEVAFAELERRASRTEVEILPAGELVVASIFASEPYKASLLLARNLKERLPSSLGWPVIAVAPARDFVYLVRKTDFEKAGGLGAIVLREFNNSGYPISTEVWEISDTGMDAVGYYPQQ